MTIQSTSQKPQTAQRPAPAPKAHVGAGKPAIAADSFRRTAAPAAKQDVGAQDEQVSGNGHGFTVFDPSVGGISKFYIHPYRFERANPKSPKGEGISTPNVLKALAWTPKAHGRSAEYLDQSQVISSKSDAGQASFMMPWGLSRPALVTTLDPKAGTKASLHLDWNQQVERQQQITVNGRPAWVVKLQGVQETMVVVPLGGTQPRFHAKQLTGATGWAIVSVEKAQDVKQAVADVQQWQGTTRPSQLPAREAAELDTWRVKPAVQFRSEQERKVWRQSETVLRMGQIREGNNAERSGQGLIVASLPESEWFIPWVRDMSYATTALAQMGHQDEARKAVNAWLDAKGMGKNLQPGDKPYQISTVRYFGNGAEEADFSDQKQANLEYDSWGLALWAMGNYFNTFNDTAWLDHQTAQGVSAYDEIKNSIAAPLFDKMEPYGAGAIIAADSSIWEQNDAERKHYAFSTIAAIGGLQNFLKMAQAKGDTAEVALVQGKLDQLRKGFNDAFVKDGKLRGSLESSPRNDMDGALLEALNMGVVDDPKLVQSTLERTALLKAESGGYRRVNGSTGYELQEFVFTDFSLARALRAQGRTQEADAIEKRLAEKAAEHKGHVPEMYQAKSSDDYDGKLGDPAGSIPMVGYGAGVFVMNMIQRDKAR